MRVKVLDSSRESVGGTHKVLQDVSMRQIKEHFLAGTYARLIDDIPEELRSEITQQYLDVVERVAQVYVTVDMLLITAPDPKKDRKSFSSFAQKFPKYEHYLYAAADDKLTKEMIVGREF